MLKKSKIINQTESQPSNNDKSSIGDSPNIKINEANFDVNNLNFTEEEKKNNYVDWKLRFKRILFCYKEGLIGNSLEKYQLFLLETGQFNANFTLEELKQLNYPKSPFAIMYKHTYLRAIDNWAMEIMRFIYYKNNNNSKNFPIWVDSSFFWIELERYCKVIDYNKVEAELLEWVLEYKKHAGFLSKYIWVKLDKSELKDIGSKEQQKHKIASKVLSLILNDNNIYPLFNLIITGQATRKYKASDAILTKLNNMFPEIMNEISKNKLPFYTDLSDWKIENYQWAFGLAKKYKRLPITIKNVSDLKLYVSQNNIDSLKLINEVVGQYNDRKPSVSDYNGSIKTWIDQNVCPCLNNILKNIIYFFKEIYNNDIKEEAIAFWDCVNVPEFVSSVMGNFGYRLDPVRAIRIILKEFPKLFVDVEETNKFWDYLMKTSMVSKLSKEEREFVEKLNKFIVSQIELPDEIVISNFNSNAIDNFIIQIDREVCSDNIQNGFNLYGKFLNTSVQNLLCIADNTFKFVTYSEIESELKKFIEAYHQKKLAEAIRRVQTISEIILLALSFTPDKDLENIILNNYFADYKNLVQGICLTPYAMRTFIRVFQLLDAKNSTNSTNIYVTNQSYFELLHNFERLKIQKAFIFLVQSIDVIKPDADIIFVDFHPNNVLDTKQFAHKLKKLIVNMTTWSNKSRTIVIDSTLNVLNDSEVERFLNKALDLIKNGRLNIIFNQSLTKFAQLGLDKRSSGMLVIINNNSKEWQSVNFKLKEFVQTELIDQSTKNFFAYFFEFDELLKKYLQLINKNVRFVYKNIIGQLNRLEVINHKRLQITTSSDPKSCYVALNVNGLLPEIDPCFNFNSQDIADFTKDVLEYIIIPLCKFFNLPITERASIGFPLTSVNIVYDAMRFTIGLESNEQLMQYAEVLTYVSFILNRKQEPEMFFEPGRDNNYLLRKTFFKEKAEQFKAMTPEAHYFYKMSFKNSSSSYIIEFNNGEIKFLNKKTKTIDYHIDDVSSFIRNYGEIHLSSPLLCGADKRLITSCFTQVLYNNKFTHDATIVFNNSLNQLTINHEVIGEWNIPILYGPFNNDIYFYFHSKDIFLYIKQVWYGEDKIVVKQGNIYIRLSDMPILDREFLIRVGKYICEMCYANNILAPQGYPLPQQHFKPCKNNISIISTQNKDYICVIEKDYIFLNKSNITIYKRFIEYNITCFNIDFWGEKTPALSRLMRLMTAIYIKEKNNKSFIARDNNYTHFLFNLVYENDVELERLFSEAVNWVISRKNLFITLLEDNVCHFNLGNFPEYSFLTEPYRNELKWPDAASSGVDSIAINKILEKILYILKLSIPHSELKPEKNKVRISFNEVHREYRQNKRKFQQLGENYIQESGYPPLSMRSISAEHMEEVSRTPTKINKQRLNHNQQDKGQDVEPNLEDIGMLKQEITTASSILDISTQFTFKYDNLRATSYNNSKKYTISEVGAMNKNSDKYREDTPLLEPEEAGKICCECSII